ncbi:hypothetical protein Tco_0298313 [Tanacetum coccineum]
MSVDWKERAERTSVSGWGVEREEEERRWLKLLKEKIRTWVKVNKDNTKKHKQGLKEELINIDILLDIGEGNSDTINKRTELSKSLQELNKLDSLELAQKTKIK